MHDPDDGPVVFLRAQLNSLQVSPIPILGLAAEQVEDFLSRAVARARAAVDSEAGREAIIEIETIGRLRLTGLRAAINVLEQSPSPQGGQ